MVNGHRTLYDYKYISSWHLTVLLSKLLKGIGLLQVMSCSCWIWVLTSQRCLNCLDMLSMGVCDSYYDIKYIIYVYMSRYILEYIPSVSIRKWWNESETFVIQHRNIKIICSFCPIFQSRIGKIGNIFLNYLLIMIIIIIN